MSTEGLASVVEHRRIVLCCGTGGVGKTTMAAALAVEGARRGRNTVVVTIDPAKRLADALGLSSLSDAPHLIDSPLWGGDGAIRAGGRLSALMLDTKSTFDRLVAKYAGGDEQARRILDNRLYRNLSTALSGTQEYMAMEKLYELHEEGGWDLIVVDTPPSRHALDFLEAPNRLTRFLDHRLVRVLLFPTRATLRMAGLATQRFLRAVSRVAGSEVVEDVIAFFQAFEGMEQGFRERARRVLDLLADPDTAFCVVTSPRRDAVEEARFFTRRLDETDIPVQALIVNLIHPRFGDERAEGLYARAATLEQRAAEGEGTGAEAARWLAGLYRNLACLQQVSAQERGTLEQLVRIEGLGNGGRVATAHVPLLPDEVHDFEGLARVRGHVFGEEASDVVADLAAPAVGT